VYRYSDLPEPLALPHSLAITKQHAVMGRPQGVSMNPQCPLWVKSGRDALKFRCPLYPRKRDIPRRNLNVRFGPIGDIALSYSIERHAAVRSDGRPAILRPALLALPQCPFYFAFIR
jgi:hypothetical protein